MIKYSRSLIAKEQDLDQDHKCLGPYFEIFVFATPVTTLANRNQAPNSELGTCLHMIRSLLFDGAQEEVLSLLLLILAQKEYIWRLTQISIGTRQTK